LSYEDNTGASVVNLLETKLLLNSTISDANKEARFILADIKDHFLVIPIRNSEYMCI